jgi:hypothetical protein
LDLIGLVNRIYNAVINIDAGRKGFATRGKEQDGRISYEDGISEAISIFQEVQVSVDPQALILSEYSFITQEFQLTEKHDKDTINSLTQAIQSFVWLAWCNHASIINFLTNEDTVRYLPDAFLALQIVENKTLYQGAEKTYPHDKNHRIKEGYPLDAFHHACRSHKTRLQNILKATPFSVFNFKKLKFFALTICQ